MSALKIFNELFNECSMKFPFEITLSNALDDIMYSKLINTKRCDLVVLTTIKLVFLSFYGYIIGSR